MGFELTTLVVIGTDCIGSCKSNYNTITTTTVPVVVGGQLDLLNGITGPTVIQNAISNFTVQKTCSFEYSNIDTTQHTLVLIIRKAEIM